MSAGQREGTGHRERADAARNRRAILAATEELLATHRPQDISMEQVAARAGVGKGTVFHRFGNRMGLMFALMVERAQSLEEAVRTGPPPLGEGAPDRDRLLAFLDAIIEVVSRNKNLMAQLAYPVAAQQHARERATDIRDRHPVYWFWHGHISALMAAQRPDIDAGMIAHMMLGSLHSEAVLDRLTTDGPARVAAAMRAVACAVLDSPAPDTAPPDAPAPGILASHPRAPETPAPGVPAPATPPVGRDALEPGYRRVAHQVVSP